jgi:hypothetical protein
MPDTKWGWLRTDKPTRGVEWIPGTIEDTYARASRYGGTWILYSASPIAEYHRVMREVAEQEEQR